MDGAKRNRTCADAIVVALAVLLLPRLAPAVSAAVNGHVQYETFGYPDPDTADHRWENFFAAVLRGRGEFTSTLTWQAEGRAVADDAGFTAGAYSPRNESRQRPFLSLVSGALDYRPIPDLRLSVGKQIVSWSIFDELQPANVMMPRDESDAFRRVEQGVNGVSVYYGSGRLFAELVVVPLAFTPSRLPQGRWNIIQEPDVIQVKDQPPVQLDETQAGARIGARIGQLDATLIGYVGRDTAAVFLPGQLILIGIENGIPIFKAQIIDAYARLRVGGLTASYPFGDRVIARTEAVYFNSPDPYHDDFLHTAGGVEYALDDWRVVLSYLRDDTTVSAPQEVTNKGERRFFQSFMFGELRYDAGGALRARLRGGYDFNGEFMLLQPEVSYRVWRTLRVALLGEVIDASLSSYTNNKISYFETITHEDRLGTRIDYDF
jgi:hypothetical protein